MNSRKPSRWNNSRPLLIGGLCLLGLTCAISSSAGAATSHSKIITNNNGDLVTVQLSGTGTLSISLVNSNRGPIDKILLQNTTSTSTLALTVKKSRTGTGLININSISGSGSLKSLNAKSANIVGSGINITGAIGALTIGNLVNSALTVGGTGVASTGLALDGFTAGTISNSSIQVGGNAGKVSATHIVGSGINLAGAIKSLTIGNLANSALTIVGTGVASTGLAMASFTAGTISNSSIQVGGHVGMVSATQMLNSRLWQGYSPVDSVYPMTGGTFTNGSSILSVSVTGLKGAAFVNSTIAAQSIGSITLSSVNSNNNGVAFGILATTKIKSVSIKQPKFAWKVKGASQQGVGDFHVRLPATVQITVAANTRTLTTNDVSNMTVSNNVYVISTNAPTAQGVHIGDVLVSSVGKGSLVKVLSVTNQNGSVVMQTTPASLTNIFQQAAFNQTIPFVPAKQLYLAPGVNVVTNTPQPTLRRRGQARPEAGGDAGAGYSCDFNFSKDLNPNGPVHVTLTGSAGLDITPNLSVNIGLFSGLQSVSASMDVDLSAEVGLSITAAGTYEKEILLAQIEGNPVVFMVGPIPVVVVPVLELYGGVKADVDGEIDYSATASDTYTAGATWQKNVGWAPISNNSIQFSTGFTKAIITGSVRGYLRPQITLDIYDVAGPDVNVEAGITLAGSADLLEEQYCWSLTGDLGASIGVDLNLFGNDLASYEKDLFSVDHKFAGTCYTLGNPPSATTAAASDVGSYSVTLNGTVNPNGLATTVQFEWGTDTSYGNTTSAQAAGSGSSGIAITADLLSLTSGTTYHYRIDATNNAGSATGNDRTFTTLSVQPGGAIPTVTTLAASTVTSNSATLNATVNPNGLATTAQFEWGIDASYGNTTTPHSLGSGTLSTSPSSTLTGLTPGTTYYFRIDATNSAGLATGNNRTFTTLSNNQPTNNGAAPTVTILEASAVASNSATLNGTVNPNGLATTAQFEWGTTTNYGNTTTLQTVGSGTGGVSVNASLTGLITNQTYHFHLIASNSAGTSTGGDQSLTTSNGLVISTGMARIAAGLDHTEAMKSDGTVWTWGFNGGGELGDGTTNNSYTPGQVIGLTGVAAISAGGEHSVVIKSDGTIWTWGINENGDLGNGSTANSSTPVQVSGLTGVVAISPGVWHMAAIKSDGTVWAWGDNYYGELGNGTTANSSTPVQVSGLTGVVAVSSGARHTVAIKSDGTVWTWGYGVGLGNGGTTNSSTPVQVSGLTGVVAISAGGDHTIAINSNGTIWTWGDNASGQLGNGTTADSYAPVQVSGLTNVIAVSAGGGHMVAIKSDGTVWTWGGNYYGELGNGTTTNSSTPVQVSGLTGVVAVSAGAGHNVAMKSDGTVWTWGYNGNGELGDGTTNNRAIPVQVPNFSLTNTGFTVTLNHSFQTTFIGIPVDLIATVSGGIAPYTYQWTDQIDTNVLTSATHSNISSTNDSYSTSFQTNGTIKATITVIDSTGATGTCTGTIHVVVSSYGEN